VRSGCSPSTGSRYDPAVTLDRSDPWAVEEATRRSGRSRDMLAVALVAVAGGLGAVLRLVDQGFVLRAVVLAVVAAGWALLVRSRPPGWRGVLLLAAVGSAATVAAWSTIGRAPVIVALLGVLVMDAAVHGTRSPTSSAAVEPVPAVAAPLVLPLAVAAQVVWFRTGSQLRVLALLSAATVVLGLYRHWPGIAGLDRTFRRAVTGFSTLVGSVIMFVVTLVFLYPVGLLARIGERSSRTGRRVTYWQAVDISVEDQRRDARFPFASTERPVRRRRNLLGLLAVVAVVASGFVVVEVRRNRPAPEQLASDQMGARVGSTEHPGSISDRRMFALDLDVSYTDLPAYSGSTFAAELQQEESEAMGGGAYTGRHVNIRDGLRVTLPAPVCDCPEADVWFVGGSAAWGEGQRDEHTIASELVRAGAADGIALDVLNLGAPGYTLEGTITSIETALTLYDQPDLIVIYDGFNDVLTEVAVAFVRGSASERPTQVPIEDLTRINDRTDEFLASSDGPRAGLAAADHYRSMQNRLERVTRPLGIEVLYYFQPDALTSEQQLEPYRGITGIGPDELMGSPLAQGLHAATGSLGDRTRDLRHLFVDHPRQIFLGLVHHNEDGARAVAKTIYPEVAAALALGGS
jgi:hypothetical protein